MSLAMSSKESIPEVKLEEEEVEEKVEVEDMETFLTLLEVCWTEEEEVEEEDC